jgi:hypothetical protein
MDLETLTKVGASVVAGQIDLMNKNIGQCMPNGRVYLTDEGRELVTQMLEEAAEPAPAPAPVAPAPRAPAAKKAAKAAAPAPAADPDPTGDLDELLGT